MVQQSPFVGMRWIAEPSAEERAELPDHFMAEDGAKNSTGDVVVGDCVREVSDHSEGFAHAGSHHGSTLSASCKSHLLNRDNTGSRFDARYVSKPFHF